jgi:hypothetical protein
MLQEYEARHEAAIKQTAADAAAAASNARFFLCTDR